MRFKKQTPLQERNEKYQTDSWAEKITILAEKKKEGF